MDGASSNRCEGGVKGCCSVSNTNLELVQGLAVEV